MKIIKFILLLFFINSCNTPTMHYYLKTDCSQISPNEFFNQIIPILKKEKFKIKEFDTQKGYLRAETKPVEIKYIEIIPYTIPRIDGDFSSFIKKFYFNLGIYYFKDSIIAVPNENVLVSEYNIPNDNVDTIKICFDENTLSIGDTWYWNIKKGIEIICGNKIKFEKIISSKNNKEKK